MTVDRATIAAYVDGELDLIAAKRIEKAMADDAGLLQAVEQQRLLRSKLAGHYAPVLDETLPDRLAALLTSNVDDSLTRRREAVEVRRPPSGDCAMERDCSVFGFGTDDRRLRVRS